MTNRDLDACISEYVMGWRFNRVGLPFSPTVGDDKKWILEQRVPNYTTDPAAAMEVLKKCVDKSGSRISINKHINGLYQVFTNEQHIIRAKTIELAIARFAFKLYGGKE